MHNGLIKNKLHTINSALVVVLFATASVVLPNIVFFPKHFNTFGDIGWGARYYVFSSPCIGLILVFTSKLVYYLISKYARLDSQIRDKVVLKVGLWFNCFVFFILLLVNWPFWLQSLYLALAETQKLVLPVWYVPLSILLITLSMTIYLLAWMRKMERKHNTQIIVWPWEEYDY